MLGESKDVLSLMLTTTEINDLSKRRAWILLAAATVGVVAVIAYFAIVGSWRDPLVDMTRRHVGKTAAELLPTALILPSFGLLLAPLVWGEHKSKCYALVCPTCNTDLTRYTRRVIATRCCHYCGTQIVEGRRTREAKVFERFSRIVQRRFLVYWFWTWPIIGLLVLSYHWIDQTAMDNCPQMLFIPGLIGTVATGWAFARTLDKRYLPQLGAAVMVFFLGVNAFW